VTTRGFGVPEMREVGHLIAETLNDINAPEVSQAVRRKVEALTNRFPLYSWKLDTVQA
jgi:glycine hydroxymethyltransferase